MTFALLSWTYPALGPALAWLISPGALTSRQHLVMLLPLCLSISVVYKTLRCDDLRQVPLAALALCTTIVVGMFAVGVGVWLLFLIMSPL